MFVDPIEDLKPQDNVLRDSWFICANLFSGDHEFGLLVNFVEKPMGDGPTIAITDVTENLYILDEAEKGDVKATTDGFVIEGDNLIWTGDESGMRLQGEMVSGEGSIDLELRRQGPALAYNGTGYFPMLDNDTPTWEYAFPAMITTGTITIKGKTYPITGNSWFDRQWVKSSKKIIGPGTHWTWMDITLSNGEIIALWDTVGTRDHSWATILHPDGSQTIADIEPVSESQSGVWTSEVSGIKWPSSWTISIPGVQTKLNVTCSSIGQETTGLPRIESVIHVEGNYGEEVVTGIGFCEMVGSPGIK